MKLIDAAIKDLEMVGDCRTCGNKTPFCDSNPDSCSGYKWRGAPPGSAAEENLPLTLEELREMDGEPVWISYFAGGPNVCMLVDAKHDVCRDAHGGFAVFENLGRTWIAYRRKPEEGTT